MKDLLSSAGVSVERSNAAVSALLNVLEFSFHFSFAYCCIMQMLGDQHNMGLTF